MVKREKHYPIVHVQPLDDAREDDTDRAVPVVQEEVVFSGTFALG
jgi:hypothetical protein